MDSLRIRFGLHDKLPAKHIVGSNVYQLDRIICEDSKSRTALYNYLCTMRQYEKMITGASYA